MYRTTLGSYIDLVGMLFVCGGQLPHFLLSGTVGDDIVRKTTMNVKAGTALKNALHRVFFRAVNDKMDLKILKNCLPPPQAIAAAGVELPAL